MKADERGVVLFDVCVRGFGPFTAVARIFCMSRKWDVKLQILPVSMVTLLIKDFAQCKLTCKTQLSFSFCVLQPCKISWPQQCLGDGLAGKDEIEGIPDRLWGAWTDRRRIIRRRE